jgi:hypothetical protein
VREASWLLVGFLTACSGWSSELNTALVEGKKSSAKPLCSFDISENCWQRSVDLLSQCAPVVSNQPEQLLEKQRGCVSSAGKVVLFEDQSLTGAAEDPGVPLSFSVYQGQKHCYDFFGRPYDFSIESPDYGSLRVLKKANGDLQVNCFFGEGFTITWQAQEQGCQGQKLHNQPLVTSFELDKTSEPGETKQFASYRLVLFGVGVVGQPLFHCRP